ncbi:hypothetical protein FNF31_07654 [Cafeteria roenbergensis]|uniref:Uncharacterized protein n=1 Tax=Cafeteria roenbergensis TaxID=33653 RepID=A0A5A8C3H7_CAFRO|nr:hypothetical protein FNF31_07654 [Cafeteria roenbergensis]
MAEAQAGAGAPRPRRSSALGDVVQVTALQEELRKQAEAEHHTFFVHGKELGYSKNSLFCLDADSSLRWGVIWLVAHPAFEFVTLMLIIANSVVLAMANYAVVTPSGQLDVADPFNRAISESELVFTLLFTVEMLLKIVAMGLVLGKGAYLRDAWNVLDCLVVVSGLVGIIPGVPNVSAIRAIRVLRPLRALVIVPGMRLLVLSLLRSVPALLEVLLLLLFAFAIFGILGIQLWSGLLHARCRLTEGPVRAVAEPGGFPQACKVPTLQCLELLMTNTSGIAAVELAESRLAAGAPGAEGQFLEASVRWDAALGMHVAAELNSTGLVSCLPGQPVDSPQWAVREDSPWFQAQPCFWPIDAADERMCTIGGLGEHACGAGRFCGSNYDSVQNARFANTALTEAGNFDGSLNWGLTTFDHIFLGVSAIFQSITMEGWTDIMYMVMDSYNGVAAGVYFVVLILFGSFFLLNLLLAVISEQFNESQKLELEAKAKKEQDKRRREQAARHAAGLRPNPARSWRRSPTRGVPLDGQSHSVAAPHHYPMDPDVSGALELAGFVLTLIFTAEMCVKVAGLGPWRFIKAPFNVFDAIIVIASLVELVLAPPAFLTATTEDVASAGGGISALRTLRLFRLFALAKQWRSLRVLIDTMLRTLKDVAYFAVLLLLFLFIFSLIGMQFFANQLCFDPGTGLPSEEFQGSGSCPAPFERPRAHFDNIFWAFLAVFQVLSEENWNAIMYDCWRAVGWPATIYFVALVVVGNFVLLNLFLAIVLGNFEGMEELVASASPNRSASEFSEQLGSAVSQAGFGKAMLRLRGALSSSKSRPLPADGGFPGAAQAAPADSGRVRFGSAMELEGHGGEASRPPRLSRAKTAGASPDDGSERPRRASVGGTPNRLATSAMLARSSSVGGGSDPSMVRHLREKKQLFGNALFVLPASNPLRKWLGKLVQSSRFESGILCLIVLSSVALALDSPFADPDSALSAWLGVMDIVFAALFTLEMVLKVLAFGFALHRNAYIRDPWNALDFAIVVISLLSIAAADVPALKSLRALRTLRALRPLRLVSRNKGMRLVVNALISSLPAIGNVLVVCLLVVLIFGIIGVSYFKGGFGQCGGDAFDAAPSVIQDLVFAPVEWPRLPNATRLAVVAQAGAAAATMLETMSAARGALASEQVCVAMGFDWSLVVDSTFDNIWSAAGTLLQMATTEGWMDVLHAGIDSRGSGMQPQRDFSPAWALFFVAFIVVGDFFVLNLFVGVVVDNFNRMKVKLGVEAGQSIFATPEQREWQKTRKYALLIRPFKKESPPRNPCRRALLAVAQHPRFEWFIVGCILLNTGAMAATFFGQPTTYSLVLDVINYVFAAIFTLEAVLKISALGCKYFHGAEDSAWNIFDFAIVVGSNLGIVLQFALGLSVGSVATVVRTFRIGRIFRLVPRAKKIQFYFSTLVQTLPSLGNIGGLLFLLFFVYAVMGVQLFAEVRHGDSLNDHANFQSFGFALLTLMRAATGEAWNYLMYDAAAVSDGCRALSSVPFAEKRQLCGYNQDPRTCLPLDGCGNSAAYVYFYSFTIIVTFIFLNLFIAVVLEAFSDTSEEEAMKLKKADFAVLAKAWMTFDPDATCLMPAAKLPSLMRKLKPPLGFDMAVRNSDARLRRAIQGLAIQIHRPVADEDEDEDEGQAGEGTAAAAEAAQAAGGAGRGRGSSARQPPVLMVHFADVAQALAHRVFDEAAKAEGKPGFEAPPATKRDRRELMRVFGKASFGHATAFALDSYVAAEAIERLFKAHKFRKRIQGRMQDSETLPARSRGPASAGASGEGPRVWGGQRSAGHEGDVGGDDERVPRRAALAVRRRVSHSEDPARPDPDAKQAAGVELRKAPVSE